VANEEHVKRLRLGATDWNWWRSQSRIGPTELVGLDMDVPEISGPDLRCPDLSRAELSRVDLSRADLNDANLRRADLKGANLTGAYLVRADLSGANLSGANLFHTNLYHADLTGANLSSARVFYANLSYAALRDADLREAGLGAANFSGANLRAANLTGAYLNETVFGDADLTGVVGLETCIHQAPSIIDHRTLEKSGTLPISFLRGIGLPDSLIEYAPALLNKALQYYSCFISYSAKDEDFANRLHADLQNMGVRCWFAPHDLPIGHKILDTIDEAIRLRDKVLVILSEHSIKSDWVEDEVKTAFEEERKRGSTVLLPIRLDDLIIETGEAWAAKLRADRNIGDFRNWKDHDAYKQSLARVLRDLKTSTKVA